MCLAGINTPERRQPFGKKATENLAHIAGDQPARVEFYKKDRWNRLIGKVWVRSPDSPCQEVSCPKTLNVGMAQLRSLAWKHQRKVYAALFRAASQTLKQFGCNPKHLGAEIGMTAILHTHSRRLTYHPHLHVVVPGGGVDRKQSVWKRTRYQYLFNEFALATVFRGKFLHEIAKVGLQSPTGTPKEWVLDCRHAGRGNSALEYLSRYLYRGMIRESNILFDRNGRVTFQYVDGETGEILTESLRGADFLWRVIQHVLPRGFHRDAVPCYAFLCHLLLNSR